MKLFPLGAAERNSNIVVLQLLYVGAGHILNPFFFFFFLIFNFRMIFSLCRGGKKDVNFYIVHRKKNNIKFFSLHQASELSLLLHSKIPLMQYYNNALLFFFFYFSSLQIWHNAMRYKYLKQFWTITFSVSYLVKVCGLGM